MPQYKIIKPQGKVAGKVHLPGSKSISNRLLVMGALSDGVKDLRNLSVADDTLLMQQILQAGPGTHNVKNAGTVARFLTAYFSIKEGETILNCHARMKERPMAPLIDALRRLGADITCLEKEGFLPLRIRGKKLKGGKIQLDPRLSSQFVSALLLIGPAMPGGIEISLTSAPSSESYLHMTLHLMRQAGVDAGFHQGRLYARKGGYIVSGIKAEADWSSAAFFYEIAALSPSCDILLADLSLDSIQGDVFCAELFHSLGVDSRQDHNGVSLSQAEPLLRKFVRPRDFASTPDLAMAYAATLAGLQTQGVLTGLSTLRDKETDRVAAMLTELAKTGASVKIAGEGLQVGPGEPPDTCCEFAVYGDHRMAMSLAPLAMIFPEVSVADPQCVEKSFPGYWRALEELGFIILK